MTLQELLGTELPIIQSPMAGVQVGTAYLLCPDVTTSGLHRAALKSWAAQLTRELAVGIGR